MQSLSISAIQALNDESISFKERMDITEGLIVQSLPQDECLVAHSFLPGLYIRTILMPAGRIITSAIHRTQHPFFIPSGDVLVGSELDGMVRYQGPFHGITKPGTRRILQTLADTVWTTYHRTEKTKIEDIISDILEPHVSEYLPEGYVPCHSRLR